MEKQGISKLISVKFSDYEKPEPASPEPAPAEPAPAG
jgi:hypothetical protein